MRFKYYGAGSAAPKRGPQVHLRNFHLEFVSTHFQLQEAIAKSSMADKPAAMEMPAAAKTAPEVTWCKGVWRFFSGEGRLFPPTKTVILHLPGEGCQILSERSSSASSSTSCPLPPRLSSSSPPPVSPRPCLHQPQGPDRMTEDMPDIMSDRMPEDMSDRMPQDLPLTKRINVMVGIARSKVIIRSIQINQIYIIRTYVRFGQLGPPLPNAWPNQKFRPVFKVSQHESFHCYRTQ